VRVRPAALVTDDEERRRARAELRRQQRQRLAEGSTRRRIDLADLRFERHGVMDLRTGKRYRVYRGEVMDAMHTPVIAWAISPDGPVFLEPA
jgi:hypothetical protein